MFSFNFKCKIIMMLDIQIRRAQKGDCSRLLELIRELAEYEKAMEQVTITLELLEESGFGKNPVWRAFVAVDTKTNIIVGFSLYYIRFFTWKGQRLYLEDIIVNKEWRGKGIRSMLFDSLLKEMKEQKFTGMMWQVLEWNKPAIKFYKKYKASFDPEWINCNIEN